jgi:hypothetical protein
VRVVKKQVSKARSAEGGQVSGGGGVEDGGVEDEEEVERVASVDASSLVARFLMEESEQRALRVSNNAVQLGEADVVDAAWRWRFARRWNAEQCREPVASDSLDDGPGVLPRGGGGGGGGGGAADRRHAEGFARQASEDILMLMSSLGRSLSLLGGTLGGTLDNDVSDGGSSVRLGQRGPQGVRTPLEAVSAAANASTLNVSSMIPTVEVDAHGAYPFILVTMRNLAGQSCILLHGHNNATHESLLQSSKRTALRMASAHGLRGETTVILGGGMMEWRDGSEGRKRNSWGLDPGADSGADAGRARARGGEHAPGSSSLDPTGPPAAEEAPSVRLSMGMACGNGVLAEEVLSIAAALLRPTLPSLVAVLVADGPPTGDKAGAATSKAGGSNGRSGGALTAKLHAMRG